jgi:cytochrome c5
VLLAATGFCLTLLPISTTATAAAPPPPASFAWFAGFALWLARLPGFDRGTALDCFGLTFALRFARRALTLLLALLLLCAFLLAPPLVPAAFTALATAFTALLPATPAAVVAAAFAATALTVFFTTRLRPAAGRLAPLRLSVAAAAVRCPGRRLTRRFFGRCHSCGLAFEPGENLADD